VQVVVLDVVLDVVGEEADREVKEDENVAERALTDY